MRLFTASLFSHAKEKASAKHGGVASRLPFCAGAQFSRDSLRAFNDRIKYEKIEDCEHSNLKATSTGIKREAVWVLSLFSSLHSYTRSSKSIANIPIYNWTLIWDQNQTMRVKSNAKTRIRKKSTLSARSLQSPWSVFWGDRLRCLG